MALFFPKTTPFRRGPSITPVAVNVNSFPFAKSSAVKILLIFLTPAALIFGMSASFLV